MECQGSVKGRGKEVIPVNVGGSGGTDLGWSKPPRLECRSKM